MFVSVESEKGENIALRAEARWSGDWGPRLSSSKFAVDGMHMNCMKSLGTIAQSYGRGHHWWSLRLPFLARVDTIVIYNRQDCCTEQLSNAEIWIDYERDDYHKTQVQQQFNETGDMRNVRAREFTSQQTLFGHDVRIKNKVLDAPLSLCEVEVYGKKGI